MSYSSVKPHTVNPRVASRPTDQTAGVYVAKKVFNRAAIRALHSAPQEIVKASAGQAIVVHNAVIHTTKATAYTGTSTDAADAKYQLTAEGQAASGKVPIDMSATGAVYAVMPPMGDDASGGLTQATQTAADVLGKALQFAEVAASGDLGGGHAADTMTVTVWFSYATLP